MKDCIQMRNITKCFGKVMANQQVDFVCEKNHIHGLIGENGAGKTTLMRMLYGMYQPDKGEILLDGISVKMRSPKDAIKNGIGMVHQHFTLVPCLSVVQNIVMSNPPMNRFGVIKMKKASEMVAKMAKDYNLHVDPHAIVGDLSVGIRQRVEILKALFLGANLLILDEPTAILTPQEIQQLFKILTSLKEKGKSTVLITHKLAEIMHVTDDITIMRNGMVTGHLETKDTNEREIASLMVGRDAKLRVDKTPNPPGEECLSVHHLSYVNDQGVKMLDDVSFTLREGEIVGIAGVQGNGQTELIDVIAGLINNYGGEINLCDQSFTASASPADCRQAGLTHIPEDRQTMGAALEASLTRNFVISNLGETGPKRLIHWKRQRQRAKDYFKLFNVKYGSIEDPAYSLSGGNLQKTIVAREIAIDGKVLIAAQPSRGVDIGATIFIHEKLLEERSRGKGILLISYELSEIMSLSDRIIVMYNGRIIGETTPEKSTEEDIGLMMVGIQEGSDDA